jgi:hypothetical protein
MKNEIKSVIKNYQSIIKQLDEKLALYEKLGSPQSISEKLGVELPVLSESVDKEIVLRKDNSRSVNLDSVNISNVAPKSAGRASRLIDVLGK